MPCFSRTYSDILDPSTRFRISALLGFYIPSSLTWSAWREGDCFFRSVPVETVLQAMLEILEHNFATDTVQNAKTLADLLVDVACFGQSTLGRMRFALALGIQWLFPPDLSWGRTNAQLTRALAALDMACACEIMLLDTEDSQKTRSKYIGIYSRFLRPKLQEALLTGNCVARFALQHWKAKCAKFFRQEITECLVESGINYIAGISRAHRNFYPGYCRALRTRGWRCSKTVVDPNLGYPARWYEHKALTIRQQYGHETRYRLWRKHSPWCTHMFVAFFGTRQAAYMREQFIFKSYTVPTVSRTSK